MTVDVKHPAWAIALLAIFALFLLAGCGGAANTDHPSDPAVYQGTELDGQAPGFRLTDQRGERVALEDFRGEIVWLSFLDPACTDVCPLNARQYRLASETLAEDAASVTIVVVNANPDAASVEDVLEAGERWGNAGLPNWHFLTGTKEELQSVWQAYGGTSGSPKPGKLEEVEHSPGVWLIDQEGKQRWYVSVNFSGAPLLSELLVQHTTRLLDQRR